MFLSFLVVSTFPRLYGESIRFDVFVGVSWLLFFHGAGLPSGLDKLHAHLRRAGMRDSYFASACELGMQELYSSNFELRSTRGEKKGIAFNHRSESSAFC